VRFVVENEVEKVRFEVIEPAVFVAGDLLNVGNGDVAIAAVVEIDAPACDDGGFGIPPEIGDAALEGLPSERYQYAEWKRFTVAPDYHVEVDDHYYSVPFGLLRETVEARFTDCTIEVLHRGSGLRATCARASCTSTRRSRSTCRRAIGVSRPTDDGHRLQSLHNGQA
jgi:hypothetical protein